MRLVSISIYRWAEQNSILLCTEQDLSMLWFYQRGIAKEHIAFNARLVSTRTAPGHKASVVLDGEIGVCYCWTTSDGISATAICDNEYPERAAFVMLGKLLMEFRETFASSGILETADKDTKLNYPQLEGFLKEWQNPT